MTAVYVSSAHSQEQCSHFCHNRSMPSRRADARVAVLTEIRDVARAQLAEVGPANLSVRAVAREMGMVSSGIYRYVESRDELLTMLVTEGYAELADAVEAAVTKS